MANEVITQCASCEWESGCRIREYFTVYNCWNYEEREPACNFDCEYYALGTCPYGWQSTQHCAKYRHRCPRYRQYHHLNEDL